MLGAFFAHVVFADSGSPACPCINPVSLGYLPESTANPGYVMYDAKRIKTDYGASCDVPDYWAPNMPDGYFNADCGSGADLAYCADAFCYVDLCTCGLSDATQTNLWAVKYATASTLAYSYDTCSRCHTRTTLTDCNRFTKCEWNADSSTCKSKTTASYVKDVSCNKGKHQCGGPTNLSCQWVLGNCEVASLTHLFVGWGCTTEPLGKPSCRCKDEGLGYGEQCRAWDFVDTLGYDATGVNCGSGAHCLDTWCFVDPCSCSAGDMFAVGGGKYASRMACAQCSSRLSQAECQRHTSCEWKDKYCIDKELADCTAPCTSTACNQDCRQEPWNAAAEAKWNCGRFTAWPPSTAPPSKRLFPCQATARRNIYFFGGGSSSELWSFDVDHARWSLVSTGGPRGRTGCSLLADEDANILFLFAGRQGGQFLNDLWYFDVATVKWVELAIGSRTTGNLPSPRHRPAATLVPNRILLFGGHDAIKVLGDWWVYNRSTDLWSFTLGSGEAIEPRADANLIYMKNFAEPTVIVYGGTAYPIQSVEYTTVYMVDLSTDTNLFLRRYLQTVQPDSTHGTPAGRYLAPTALNGNDIIVGFGWSSSAGVTFDDMWALRTVETNATGGGFTHTHSWECLIPLDDTRASRNLVAVFSDRTFVSTNERDSGWSGRDGAFVGGYFYIGSGWVEGLSINALRRVKIADLEDATCKAATAVTVKTSRLEKCRFAMYPNGSFSMNSPPARYGHGSAVSIGTIFVFGGRSDEGDLMDFWSYNETQWFTLQQGPSARSHMVFVAVRDLLWMFGGLSGDSALGDTWIYDPINDRWAASAAPPPTVGSLAKACATVDLNGDVWIYGGQKSDGTESDKLWKVEILLGRWVHMGQWKPRADCALIAGGSGADIYISVVLGRTGSDTYATGAFWKINTTSPVTGTEIVWPASMPAETARAEAAYVTVGSDLYLVGGRVWNAFFLGTDSLLLKLSFSHGQVVDAVILPKCPKTQFCWAPPAHQSNILLRSASVVHFKNKLVVFGGDQPARQSADFLFLAYDNLPCSPGSAGPTCTLAGVGTYHDALADVLRDCGKGTSNAFPGAFSKANCRKCDAGFYADSEGLSQCKVCLEGKVCLVGSSHGVDSQDVHVQRTTITNPLDLKRLASTVEDVVFILTLVSLGLFGTFILTAVVLLCVKGARITTGKLAPLDLFFKEVLRTPNGEPRPSIVGAIFTVLMMVLAIYFSGGLIIGYVLDRVEETKAIIPYVVGETILNKAPEGEELAGFVFNAVITLRLWGNGADCGGMVPHNCSSNINVGMVPRMPCERTQTQCTDVDGVCSITFRGAQCLLGIDPVEVQFQLLHPEAEATQIESNISLSSSIPQENSNHDDVSRIANAVLVKTFVAQSGTVFKGLTPSRVQVVCVPSVYTLGEGPDYNALQTGMHVELVADNTYNGAMSDAAALTYSQGLYVTVGLQRGTTALRTNRKDEKSIAEAIGEAGGFVSSMISFAALALIVVDVFIRKSLRKENRRGERVYGICEVASDDLRLDVPSFYVRFTLGRPQQFKYNELDEDLIKVSPDIAAQHSECGEKESVVLNPVRFEVLLREEDLDVDLAMEFETLAEIEVQCSIELLDSSKGRVLASGRIPFSKCSECATKVVTTTLDVYPPKKMKRSSLKKRKESTKAPVGTLHLSMNRFIVRAEDGYQGLDNRSRALVLPADCVLLQNQAEASLALYKLERKIEQLSTDYVNMSLDERGDNGDVETRIVFLETMMNSSNRTPRDDGSAWKTRVRVEQLERQLAILMGRIADNATRISGVCGK